MTIAPQTFTWDGEAMRPLNPRLADRQYTVGETYSLVPHEDRSAKSHAHFFACINDAWENLPDHIGQRFATPEHFRKYLLIRAGFRDERTIVCASKAEAQRLAAFIRPMDDYAIVQAHEATVTVYTAKSQSMKAMGRADFQASKDACLTGAAAMIGTDSTTLQHEAGRAA